MAYTIEVLRAFPNGDKLTRTVAQFVRDVRYTQPDQMYPVLNYTFEPNLAIEFDDVRKVRSMANKLLTRGNCGGIINSIRKVKIHYNWT